MTTLRVSLPQLVALCYERLVVIAYPPDGEPSPVLTTGEPPSTWAELAGLHSASHPPPELSSVLIQSGVAKPLDTGDNNPANIALLALQRMCQRAEAERVRGLPMRYRPVTPPRKPRA